jgi:hypothetical protein
MANESRPMDPPRPASRNTCWIECKLPWGLDLYLHTKGQTDEGKPIMIRMDETCVHLNGANSKFVTSGGAGLTEVPVEFWEAWTKEVGPRFQPLRSGAIMMQPTRERAFSESAEHAKEKIGLEPIDPDHPEEALLPHERGTGIERVPEKEQLAARAMGGVV